MRLNKQIGGSSKKQITYGKEGDKVELVSQSDAEKLKDPFQVVIVRKSAIGIRTIPFAVLVKDLDQND